MFLILKSILSRKSLNYKTNFSGDRKKLDYFNETGRRKNDICQGNNLNHNI